LFFPDGFPIFLWFFKKIVPGACIFVVVYKQPFARSPGEASFSHADHKKIRRAWARRSFV
jgi:hypothetical protein